jgi:glycerol-3-phosphate acyltransferase PlsY
VGIVVVCVVSYIAGSIPFSYLAGRAFAGLDLRKQGSGNLGATNTFRFLGVKIAVIVLVADIAKGFFPTFYAPAIGSSAVMGEHALMLLAGFFAVLGHMFSPFVGFKGGKGIATTAGAFLAIAPFALLGAFAVWLATMLVTRIVSVASLAGAVTLPLWVYLSSRFGWGEYHGSVLALSFAIAAVVLIKHRSNIKRLLAGTEPVLQRHKPENHGNAG